MSEIGFLHVQLVIIYIRLASWVTTTSAVGDARSCANYLGSTTVMLIPNKHEHTFKCPAKPDASEIVNHAAESAFMPPVSLIRMRHITQDAIPSRNFQCQGAKVTALAS